MSPSICFPSLLGVLLVGRSLCYPYGPLGTYCHIHADCASNYCTQQRKCELPGDVGDSCPAGVNEACLSYRCKGGFCVASSQEDEYETRWRRWLQNNTAGGGNATTAALSVPAGGGNATAAAPSVVPAGGGNVTMAPTAPGTVGANVTAAPSAPGGASGNVTVAPSVAPMGTAAPAAGTTTTTVAPSAPTWDGTVTLMPNETHDGGNIFDHSGGTGTMANASGSVAPRPTGTTANASGSVAPRPTMGNASAPTGLANGTVTPRPTPLANATVAPAPTLPPTCMIDADCGDEDSGYFCSSINICEELNCVNWANNTPPGNLTYSEAPCTEEGAEAGTAFCGWDGNCYAYDCTNWYTYGPVAFTGYDPNNPVELDCQEYNNGYDENMNSVTFGCRTWEPGAKAPEAISWTHFYNYECVANPRNNDEFKCYQNMPNTDYRDFQSGVARLNPDSCDREIYGDLIEQPVYWYVIQAWQDRKDQVDKYKNGRAATLNSDSFNANLAEKTMFSLIISADDAPEQTFPDAVGGEAKSGAEASQIMGSKLDGLPVTLLILFLL